MTDFNSKRNVIVRLRNLASKIEPDQNVELGYTDVTTGDYVIRLLTQAANLLESES